MEAVHVVRRIDRFQNAACIHLRRQRQLHEYAVDFIAAIQVADELHGFSFDRAKARAEQILGTTRQILAMADADGIPPAVAADRLAERRIAEVGRLRGIYLGR